MDELFIEIRDEEINVEEIMKKIRDNIRRKRKAGLLPPDPEDFLKGSIQYEAITPEIAYLESHSDVSFSPYHISSHKPYIGPFLVKGRQVINEEVKRYITPLLARQSEWNRKAFQVFNSLFGRLFEIEKNVSDIEKKITEIDSLILTGNVSIELQKKIHNEFSSQIKKIIEKTSEELLSLSTFQRIIQSNDDGVDREVINKIRIPPADELNPNNYLEFENQFRGSREEIKIRTSEYLNFFLGCSNVLDIGCGRGEFLEIMREKGIGTHGIDINRQMIEYCLSLNLNVTMIDGIQYLEKIEDESLDGIFIDQVVEHLEPSYLIRLLQLCNKKLMAGKFIIVETVNPLSFTSLANFYIDLTHVKPIHPETLKYLFSFANFQDVEVKFTSPMPKQVSLQLLSDLYPESIGGKKNIDIVNQNFRILNELIFGSRDYGVIGKK